MPTYIDSHAMNPFTAEQLRTLQQAPKDEFGITHHDILFSQKDDRIWCVLDGPDQRAVDRHHEKAGIRCDWIHEVQSSRM